MLNTGAGVQSRYALLGEGEVIGAVEGSSLRFVVRKNDAILLGGRRRHVVVHLGLSETHDANILHPAVDVQAVHVDDAGGFRQRVDGIPGVVIRTEKSLFLAGHGEKEDGPGGWKGERFESIGQLDECPRTRGVIESPVIYLIALESGIFTEVIPVGRINNDSSARSEPGTRATTLREMEFLHRVLDGNRCILSEGNRFEIRCEGRRFHFLEAHAGGFEDLRRRLE